MGDVCYGMENAGYRILASSDVACESLPGGVGTFDSCEFELDFVNATATMNFGAVYKGILGGDCAVDPLGDVWTSISDSIRTLPSDYIDPFVDGGLGGFALRKPMVDTFKQFSSSMGLHLGDFVLDVGEGIGCQGLHNAYIGFKNALCCETLNAGYWALSSFYLIAFSMCLCGCTASVMGMKRFRNKLWGRHYDEAMEEIPTSPVDGDVEMVNKGGDEQDPYGGYGEADPYAAQGYEATGYDDAGYDDPKA